MMDSRMKTRKRNGMQTWREPSHFMRQARWDRTQGSGKESPRQDARCAMCQNWSDFSRRFDACWRGSLDNGKRKMKTLLFLLYSASSFVILVCDGHACHMNVRLLPSFRLCFPSSCRWIQLCLCLLSASLTVSVWCSFSAFVPVF